MRWPMITFSFVNTGTGERDSSLASHDHTYTCKFVYKEGVG